MIKPHRRAHRLMWLALTPLILLLIWRYAPPPAPLPANATATPTAATAAFPPAAQTPLP